METAFRMTKDEAIARRAEIRRICNGPGEPWELYSEEMEAVNQIAGIKDCISCDRDFDANYPDDYCPWCVTVYNGADWDWPQDRYPWIDGVRAPDIPEGQGVWCPQCPNGLGEMRCLYVEGHTGAHRFRYPNGKITDWPA